MRRSFSPRLLAGMVLVLLATACGGTEPAGEPDATTSPAATEDAPEATQEVTAWFVRATQDQLWVEPETALRPPTEGVAGAAFELLFEGEPRNPDLSSVVTGVEVLGVDREDDVLVVDVADDIDPEGSGHSSTEETAFAAQLAYTATQFDDVRAVRLLVEGEPIEDLWGHLDWSEPIEPEPFRETPITIERPAWGDEVELGELTASGQANTFEATLAVRLIDPDGETVEEQWITATSGSGTRGTWAHTFSVPLDRPGAWVVEVEEPDPSGGAEGRPPLVVRSEFEAA